MDEFFDASKVLIVAGKGGVGKTTVCAALGLAAARSGRDVLLIELEGNSTLGFPYGHGPLEYEEQEIRTEAPGRIRGRRITPDEALADYLGAHGLERVSGRLSRSGAIEVVSSAAPGIRDLLALGRIRSFEENNEADLILVDAPAAGHAISFLKSPAGLLGSATGGPVKHQAETVLELLGDASRCQTMLVTTPEETPVSELIDTAFALEEEVGVQLAPVVINSVWPVIAELGEHTRAAQEQAGADHPAVQAAEFRLRKQDSQTAQRERLMQELPLPAFLLPFLFTAGIGPQDLTVLADALMEGPVAGEAA